MKPKLVIFDLAATLSNYYYYTSNALKNTFSADGVMLSDEDIAAVTGIPDVVGIRQILRSQEQYEGSDNETLLRRKYKLYANYLINLLEEEEGITEMEGVSQMFKTLKENKIKVMVMSNLPMAATSILIKKREWIKNKLISGVITTSSKQALSPSPEIIFMAMKRSGVSNSKHVVKVGASPYDLIQGTAAGCGLVIGVPSQVFPEEVLCSVYHQNFATDVNGILDFIDLPSAILV